MYNGLTNEEVQFRINNNLINKEKTKYSRTINKIILSNVFSLFNILMFTLALCVFFTGSYHNMLFIFIAIINTVIAIYQEIKAKYMIDKLTKKVKSKVKVIRNNELITILDEEIVIDDLLSFKNGDIVVVDTEVIISDICEVDESIITGESIAIIKNKGDTLYAGSIIISGNCKAKVTALNSNSYSNKMIKEAASINEENSYLKESLNKVLKIITITIIPISFLLLIVQVFFTDLILKEALLSTVAGIIGMIPSGLMLLTNVALSVGVIKMAKKNVIIEELNGIETLSCIDVLCLDKTGTITDNTLEVIDYLVLDKKYDIPSIIKNMIGDYLDNATDYALNKYFDMTKKYEVIKKVPFSSYRKYSSVVFKDVGLFTLGALEYITKDTKKINKYESIINKYASDGYRILTLAHSKTIPSDQSLPASINPIAFIIIKDNIRKNVGETLEYFKKQDVTIKIISGDNPLTVSSTMRLINFEDYDKYVDASTLPDDYDELIKIIDNYSIFGRTTPKKKQLIIKALKHNNRVGMVGDGVNDILALREAHSSISLASGSDSAKSVSQIILIDSDFTILPSLVEEGRRIVNNITKVGSLYLVKTIYSFLISLMAIIAFLPYPFYPIQLTLISGLCVGIPSFFLSMIPNNDKIKKDFIYEVFENATKGGLCITINIILISIFCHITNIDYESLRFTIVAITGIISLYILYLISTPFNYLKRLIFYFQSSIFILSLILIPKFLEINKINILQVIILLFLFIIDILIIKYIGIIYKKHARNLWDKFSKKN